MKKEVNINIKNKEPLQVALNEIDINQKIKLEINQINNVFNNIRNVFNNLVQQEEFCKYKHGFRLFNDILKTDIKILQEIKFHNHFKSIYPVEQDDIKNMKKVLYHYTTNIGLKKDLQNITLKYILRKFDLLNYIPRNEKINIASSFVCELADYSFYSIYKSIEKYCMHHNTKFTINNLINDNELNSIQEVVIDNLCFLKILYKIS